MAKATKLLDKMRQSPRDWSIADLETLCAGFDVACKTPKRGSHCGVSDKTQNEILTVPINRPIKQVYIKKLVAFIDAVQAARVATEGK
jgi:hypothetical protein